MSLDISKLYKTVFAIIPRRRSIRTPRGFEFHGWYWLRKVKLMKTNWNGWTAFGDDNDAKN